MVYLGSCQARRALVRLCPEAKYLVCPEASLLQAGLRVALGLLELLQV